MEPRDDGGPAFPGLKIAKDGELMVAEPTSCLTIRDYFAAAFLTGVIANKDTCIGSSIAEKAESAYRHADAMLAARKK